MLVDIKLLRTGT